MPTDKEKPKPNPTVIAAWIGVVIAMLTATLLLLQNTKALAEAKEAVCSLVGLLCQPSSNTEGNDTKSGHTVSLFFREEGSRKPIDGVRVQVLDFRTAEAIPDRSVTTKKGMAALQEVPTGAYILLFTLERDGSSYAATRPVELTKDILVEEEFIRAAWENQSDQFANPQIPPPSAALISALKLGAAPPWIKIALDEVGQSEIEGRCSPRLLEYLAPWPTFTRDAAQPCVPWASAYANFVMEKAGIQGTRSLQSRSWLNWGKSSEVVPGCIAIFWTGDPNAQSGQVGFVLDQDESKILIVAGNISKPVDRYNSAVSTSWYPRSRLLGCRMPG